MEVDVLAPGSPIADRDVFSLVDVRFCENEWETAFAHFHRVVLKTVSKEI
jgi:hypothetical protein